MTPGSIRQGEWREYAARQPIRELAENRKHAKVQSRKTAFLSHSRRDRDLAKGLQRRLCDHDMDIYVDWEDNSLPETPDRETAERIQSLICACDVLLFLATQNSLQSRWCPWELGHADGKKPHDSIVVVPTLDDHGNYHDNEYMQLYNRLRLT